LAALGGAAAAEYSIRPAGLADARAIARVHVTSWRETYRGLVTDSYLDALDVDERETGWRDALTCESPRLWLAESGGQVVGWVAFGPAREPDARADSGEIWALYVLQAHWAQQLGSRLMRAACAALAEGAMTDVCLWVMARNGRARAFYERLGFVVEAQSLRQFELGGAMIDELRYWRGLEPALDTRRG
jgi:ribosomal protein S18 acetylase RimI-like enzyme